MIHVVSMHSLGYCYQLGFFKEKGSVMIHRVISWHLYPENFEIDKVFEGRL